MADSKCLPKVPWPRWAVESGFPQGEKDHENWRYIEQWAQRLIDLGCAGGGLGTEVYCASWNGLLVGGPRSGRYYAPGVDLQITGFTTSLITAGSTNTTIRLLRGTGTGAPGAVQSWTLTSGVQYLYTASSATVDDGQYFQIEIQSAGTGAIGLNVQVGYTEVV